MLKISTYKNILYTSLAFVMVNLFFINKAFNIDDTFTISMTKSISRDFFKPEGFFSNPPFLGYYYLPVLKIFGEQEAAYHIFYLPFTVLAIISMFMLSKRFVKESLLPVLSFIVTPAFLVISQSIILDIPLVAFFLCALAFFIYGIDKNDGRLLLLSGVCTAAAILIKYSGLLLIPAMLVYALLFAKNRQRLVVLLLPILIFLLWGCFCIIKYGNFSFIHAALVRLGDISAENLFVRLLACLSFIPGSSLLALFLLPLIAYKISSKFIFSAALLSAVLLFYAKETLVGYSFLEKFILFVFFSASIFLIFLKLRPLFLSLFKKSIDKESIFLSLWFLPILIFIILVQSVSVRFILLLFPPMFLFLYRQLDRSWVFEYFNFKKINLLVIAFVFIISLIVAIGDYRFAGVYRNFAFSLRQKISEDTKIYFPDCFYSDFCSWGFSYYLDKYFPNGYYTLSGGLRQIFKNENNVLIISPVEPVLPIAVGICPLPEFESHSFTKVLIDQFKYDSFVFLHHRRRNTGFYSHDWGLFPFKILTKKAKLEEFNIYKITPHPIKNQGNIY